MALVDTIPQQRAAQEAPLRAAAAAGDRQAFAQLWLATREELMRYLLRRTGGDRHLAEDLASETYLKALRGISGFREMNRPFIAWLTAIATHLVYDHFKSAHYSRTACLQGGDLAEIGDAELLTAEMDIAESACERIQRQRRARVLAEACNRLTPLQQEVLALRYLDGLSIRDTARKLDCREGAVKALAYRGTRQLAEDTAVQQLWQEPT